MRRLMILMVVLGMAGCRLETRRDWEKAQAKPLVEDWEVAWGRCVNDAAESCRGSADSHLNACLTTYTTTCVDVWRFERLKAGRY